MPPPPPPPPLPAPPAPPAPGGMNAPAGITSAAVIVVFENASVARRWHAAGAMGAVCAAAAVGITNTGTTISSSNLLIGPLLPQKHRRPGNTARQAQP